MTSTVTIEWLYGNFFDRPHAPPTSTYSCVWRRCDNRGTKSRAVDSSGGRSELVVVRKCPIGRPLPIASPLPAGRTGSVGNVQCCSKPQYLTRSFRHGLQRGQATTHSHTSHCAPLRGLCRFDDAMPITD